MKKLILLSTLLITATFFTACKKQKLTGDSWYVTQATDLSDGTDITEDYQGDVWTFEKNGDYLENNQLKGTWKFSDDKDQLIITEIDNSVDIYAILKLKSKEMQLQEGEEELVLNKLD